MVRVNHYVKPNLRSELPWNLFILDTETRISTDKDKVQHHTFRLGSGILLERKDDGHYTRQHYQFWNIEKCWEILDRFCGSRKKLYVIAHNMAFDYAILKFDTYLSSRNLEITMRVLDSVFMVKAKPFLFFSSTNYYKQKLEELGQIFGLSKMESPNFLNVSDSELMTYCQRDTEVLSNIIERYIDFIRHPMGDEYEGENGLFNDLGSFKPTIAGQALTAYRHHKGFMEKELFVHNFPDINDMELKSYRGGRCEVFKMGKYKDITCLDINSMYPFVMKRYEYPVKFPFDCARIRYGFSSCQIHKALDSNKFVLAECKLELKKPVIACNREKLLFPIGKIKEVLTSPEIEYILENEDCGKILAFNKVVIYEKEKIFENYIDFFYSLRSKSENPAIKSMCKLFLNSLYGKFGQHCCTIPTLITDENQKRMYFEMMDSCKVLQVDIGDFTKYVRLGNDLYHIEKKEGELAHDAIIAIASSVTAYGRMMLWNLIQKAGMENVLYCDTDSLFVNSDGLDNLKSEINPTELGKLKIEKFGSCNIRGPKDYIFNGVTKLKGVKENAEKIAEDTFIQYHFITKNQRYREGIPDGTVVVRPVVKKISRNYDKGIVLPDGQVQPLVFAE